MDIKEKRKALVPTWIKVFGWIFLIATLIVPVGLILFPVLELPAKYEIFGWSYEGSPFAPEALFIQGIFLFMGVTAYGLLFGKDWGVNACIANGYIGIGLCGLSMVLTSFTYIRLEPLIQIPYLVKLHKIKNEWHSGNNAF